MNTLLPILRGLREADVSFVVVGGVAVVLRGHPRLTVDLDVALDLRDDDNVRRAVAALTGLGLVPRLPVDATDFADAAVRQRWVEDRNLQVFSLHDPDDPRREVDLFAQDPLPYADLEERASLVEVEGLGVPVASRRDLITMKRDAGRAQDLADIEALEALEDVDDDPGE